MRTAYKAFRYLFLLPLVWAFLAVLGTAPGVPVTDLPRATRRGLLRAFARKRADEALQYPRTLLRLYRWLYRTHLVLRADVKYSLIHGAARLLAAYCWAIRPEGYEGYRMSYWRWLATIHLALKEREQRATALALGYKVMHGSGGAQVYHTGAWKPVPAGGATITRVGQVSPLYYKKVAGGLPVLQNMSVFPGNIFYVDSGNTERGSDTAGFGTHPDTPFLTIDFAIGQCTGNQADVIFALPGHNDAVSSGVTIDADVAGISIVGVGRGPDRPRVDFDHAAGSIDIGASGVLVKNILCLPSVTIVTIGIDVETTVTDTLLEDIEAIPGEDGGGTDEFVDFIQTKATCTRTTVKGLLYSHHASADGAVSAVHVNGISDRVRIKDFWIEITGTAAEAGIKGTGVSTRALIEEGVITTDAEPGIEFDGAATGLIRNVTIFANLATIDAATVATGMAHDNVRYVEVGNEASTRVKTESVND